MTETNQKIERLCQMNSNLYGEVVKCIMLHEEILE